MSSNKFSKTVTVYRIMTKDELIEMVEYHKVPMDVAAKVIEIFDNCNGHGASAFGLWEDELESELKKTDENYEPYCSHSGPCVGTDGRIGYGQSWESVVDDIDEVLGNDAGEYSDEAYRIFDLFFEE